jgi:valyl-tRNA synthetase
MDRWVLSRLDRTVAAVTSGIEDYTFVSAVSGIYDFAWHDFCDRYLEAVKPRLRAGDPAAQGVCLYVLDVVMRLLHPFMPFITEELWHRLPGERDYLVRAPWPSRRSGTVDEEAEARVERLMALIEEVRRARKAARAPETGGQLAFEAAPDSEVADLVSALAAVEVVPAVNGDAVALTEAAASVRFPAVQGGDASRERERLHKELERAEAKLANPDFVAKAPAAVVEKERARRDEVLAALERLA